MCEILREILRGINLSKFNAQLEKYADEHTLYKISLLDKMVKEIGSELQKPRTSWIIFLDFDVLSFFAHIPPIPPTAAQRPK